MADTIRGSTRRLKDDEIKSPTHVLERQLLVENNKFHILGEPSKLHFKQDKTLKKEDLVTNETGDGTRRPSPTNEIQHPETDRSVAEISQCSFYSPVNFKGHQIVTSKENFIKVNKQNLRDMQRTSGDTFKPVGFSRQPTLKRKQ